MPRRSATEEFYRSLVRDARRKLRAVPCQAPGSLAKSLACSERTLTRAFAAAGTTLRDERKRIRLDTAAKTLLGGGSVADAARAADYASPRQLAAPFRDQFGVTPSRMHEIGGAVRGVKWQAAQPGPYRGSWQQRHRAMAWRARRRLLHAAMTELAVGTVAHGTVRRALDLRLPRLRTPPAPLTLYEILQPMPGSPPERGPQEVRLADASRRVMNAIDALHLMSVTPWLAGISLLAWDVRKKGGLAEWLTAMLSVARDIRSFCRESRTYHERRRRRRAVSRSAQRS